MIQGILLILICGLIGFVAIKLAIAAAVLVALVVGGAVRWVLVPAVMLVVGVFVGLARGLAWTVAEVVTMPIKLARMSLTPDRRTRQRAAQSLPMAMGTPCSNARCLCVNPAQAAFCRRCGGAIASGVRHQNQVARRHAPQPARYRAPGHGAGTTPRHRSFRLTIS